MGFKSRKNSKKTEGIIVGSSKKPAAVQPVEKKRKPISKRTKIVVVAIAFTLILLAGAVWVYNDRMNVSVYDIPDMGSEVTSPPAQDESPLIEPAAEITGIQEQIDSYPSDKLSPRQKLELAILYSALGAAYSNNGQGNDAIAAYETADTYASKEQKRAITGGLAYSYAAMGKTDEAIVAFEELIDIIQVNPDAFSDRDIAGYQREIEKLKNGTQL